MLFYARCKLILIFFLNFHFSLYFAIVILEKSLLQTDFVCDWSKAVAADELSTTVWNVVFKCDKR